MRFSLEYSSETDNNRYNKKIIDANKANIVEDNRGLKIAFLILAHKNPSQIVNFVDLLDCEDTSFYIHIDKKSDIADHPMLDRIKNRDNVVFIKERQQVSWGGYGDVEATLILLRECLRRGDCDYISLHSGQDLPIKNRHEILNYLKRNNGKEFIEYFTLNKDGWWPDNPQDRIKYYWFIEELGFEESWQLYKEQKEFNVNRKFLNNIKPYAGWQWWTITKQCAQYILSYVNNNKSFCDYYKYTLLPDEGFFQTIIMNSHFRDRVINNHLRYVEGEKGQMHPKTFTKYDYERIISSDRLFARKFDVIADETIIQMIIKKIG